MSVKKTTMELGESGEGVGLSGTMQYWDDNYASPLKSADYYGALPRVSWSEWPCNILKVVFLEQASDTKNMHMLQWNIKLSSTSNVIYNHTIIIRHASLTELFHGQIGPILWEKKHNIFYLKMFPRDCWWPPMLIYAF